MMDYDRTIRWLFDLQKFGIKLGLHNITALLAELGDPHLRLKTILVGGTNGKGSTATFIDGIARRAGLTCGLYTSPHLQRFNERIQVGGETISDDLVVEQTLEIKAAMDAYNERRKPADRMTITFFEFTTIMAIRHFLACGCDLAVFEVGMGGRLDATNILPALVRVVTTIGLEHRSYLGDTIEEIAYEKAGIIGPGATAVTSEIKPEALAVLRSNAQERGATLLEWPRDFQAAFAADGTIAFSGLGRELSGLVSGIPGRHQLGNVACAVAAWLLVEKRLGLAASDQDLKAALAAAALPGRLFPVRDRPLVYTDVAHNPDAVVTVVDYFREKILPDRPRPIVLMGMMKDKDAETYMRRLARIADGLILTRSQAPEARPVEELLELAAGLDLPIISAASVAEGMKLLAGKLNGDDSVGLITGSFYVVGEALDYLDENPGWPETDR